MCVIICLAFEEEEEEAALLHLAVRSRSVIVWVLLTCRCVRVCWVSFSLFVFVWSHCCLDYAGREGGVREGGKERGVRRERETQREERVGQQPRQRKAINKQTDWNTGIGILVFPSPHHHTGCSSTVNTLQLRMSEASIGFALPFL